MRRPAESRRQTSATAGFRRSRRSLGPAHFGASKMIRIGGADLIPFARTVIYFDGFADNLIRRVDHRLLGSVATSSKLEQARSPRIAGFYSPFEASVRLCSNFPRYADRECGILAIACRQAEYRTGRCSDARKNANLGTAAGLAVLPTGPANAKPPRHCARRAIGKFLD